MISHDWFPLLMIAIALGAIFSLAWVSINGETYWQEQRRRRRNRDRLG